MYFFRGYFSCILAVSCLIYVKGWMNLVPRHTQNALSLQKSLKKCIDSQFINRNLPRINFSLDSSNTKLGEAGSNENKGGIQSQLKSIWQKYETIWKQYGNLAIIVYWILYLSSIASIFFLIDFKIFNPADHGFDPVKEIAKVRLLNKLYIDLSLC